MVAHARRMSNAARNPVVHFEVLGRDAAALRTFYSDAFGWQLGPASGPMDYSMVHMSEGGGIDGGIGKTPAGAGHVTFYVGVEDLDSALEQIGRLGGTTVQPPTPTGDGGVTFALFADPEGHVVGLVKE